MSAGWKLAKLAPSVLMVVPASLFSLFDKCPPLLPEDVARSVVEAIQKNKVHVELPKMVSVTTKILR